MNAAGIPPSRSTITSSSYRLVTAPPPCPSHPSDRPRSNICSIRIVQRTSDSQKLSSHLAHLPSWVDSPVAAMTSNVLLIGWDGADWRILDPLLERGVLPNLAALIERGGRSDLTSTLPTHSWTAWPSFLTGVDPDWHGVYDILEGRGGNRQFPVTFRSIKE